MSQPAEIQTQDPDQQPFRSRDTLRAAFVEAFAAAPAAPDRQAQDYVLVQAGGHGYALPAIELRGIQHDCMVVAVPSASAALAGLAGVRGALVPIFDLAGLMTGTSAIAPRSRQELTFALAVVQLQPAGTAQGQSTPQAGLAFEQLERFVRVSAATLLAADADTTRSMMHEDQLYTIVDVPALMARLSGAPSASASLTQQQPAGATLARDEDQAL